MNAIVKCAHARSRTRYRYKSSSITNAFNDKYWNFQKQIDIRVSSQRLIYFTTNDINDHYIFILTQKITRFLNISFDASIDSHKRQNYINN